MLEVLAILIAISIDTEETETLYTYELMHIPGINTSCDSDKQLQPRRLCQPQDAVHSKRNDPPNACGRYSRRPGTFRLPEYTYCGAGVRSDGGVVLR